SPLIPLVTIGVGLVVARGVVAALGSSTMTVSTYTGFLLLALATGAGTDYSVFLLSRYHEGIGEGLSSHAAVVQAGRRVGPVIVASGLTVIATCACLAFADLSMFSTTGPAIAVAVAVTLLA